MPHSDMGCPPVTYGNIRLSAPIHTALFLGYADTAEHRFCMLPSPFILCCMQYIYGVCELPESMINGTWTDALYGQEFILGNANIFQN